MYHTIADGGAEGDVLLGGTGNLLGGHFDWFCFGLAVENEGISKIEIQAPEAAGSMVVWAAHRTSAGGPASLSAVGRGRIFCALWWENSKPWP